MNGPDISFYSILPPVLVLVLGYLTKRVLWSLFSGLLLGAYIAKGADLLEGLSYCGYTVIKNLELEHFKSLEAFWGSWNALICLFLIILGILITLIHHSGGAFAYKNMIRRYISSARGAEVSSLILSKILFIDDYFSSLTVGSVMRPATDSFKIPRAKLAFLVDSMAAPLAILCPVSSWVAAIIGFLKENGVHDSVSTTTRIICPPFEAYLSTLPYVFYSFILLIMAWFIVLGKISFGYMSKHETHAQKTGDLFYKNPPKSKSFENISFHQASVQDFTIPIGFLLVAIIMGLAYSGGWSIWSSSPSLVHALRNSSAALGLFSGGLVSLIFALFYFVILGKVSLKKIPSLFYKGTSLMLPSIGVLILAWSLGDILRNDLKTGHYLANLFVNSISIQYLPAVFFIASCLVSFALGSSWGSAAIMFPIAIEMLLGLKGVTTVAPIADLPLMFPLLGATLSGCVAGDHISPISDTTIMTATSTEMVHDEHVQTQMSYSLPIIIMTALSYYLVGALSLWSSFLSVLVVGGVLILGMGIFYLLHKRREASFR